MGEHNEEVEDFSFPSIGGLSHLNFSQLPPSPFWFVSKTAPEPAEPAPQLRRGKSFSEAKTGRPEFDDSMKVVRVNSFLSDAVAARFVEDEEKMDMLWEDLNEEPCGGQTAWSLPSNMVGKTNFSTVPAPGLNDQVHLEDHSNAKGMKNQKVRDSLVPHGKSSFPAVLKVLKKLFLTHSTSHHKKG